MSDPSPPAPEAKAFAEIIWKDVLVEWRDRRFDILDKAVIDRGVDPSGIRDQLKINPEEDKKKTAVNDSSGTKAPVDVVNALVKDALDSQKDDIEGTEIVAIWIYGCCLKSWELTAKYERIRGVIEGLRHWRVEELRNWRGPPDHTAGPKVIDLIVEQASCIKPAMEVEASMNCSCHASTVGHATKVVKNATEVLDSCERLVDERSSRGPASLVEADAKAHRLTYDAIATFASALDGHFYPQLPPKVRPKDPATLDEAKHKLETAVAGLETAAATDWPPPSEGAPDRFATEPSPDRYASELRTHLAVLHRLIASRRERWLRIDEAQVIYIYPFSFGAVNGSEVLRRFESSWKNERDSWQLTLCEREEEEKKELGKIIALAKRPLGSVLTDMWESADPPMISDDDGAARTYDAMISDDDGAARTYDGVEITLPEISAKTRRLMQMEEDGLTIDQDVRDWLTEDFQAAIRLSAIGNHHICIRGELRKANVHKVNQALRRGSDDFGDEKIHFGAENKVTTSGINEYARMVMDAVATKLSEKASPKRKEDAGQPVVDSDDPFSADRVVAGRGGDFHVIVVARRMSLQKADGTWVRDAAIEDLRMAFGARLLSNPVTQLATSLEEWVRYPHRKLPNILEEIGYQGDFAQRTANTTFLYMPDSPLWLVDEFRDGAEFVASLPALLKAWNKETLFQSQLVRKVSDEAMRSSDADKSVDVRPLLKKEQTVRAREADVQQQLAWLRSSSLVNTRPQREYLDALWAASSLPKMKQELDDRLAQMLAQYQRTTAIVGTLEVEARNRFASRIQIAFAAITVLSVSDFLGWLDELFGWDTGWGSTAATLEIAAIIAAAVAMIILFRWNSLTTAKVKKLAKPMRDFRANAPGKESGGESSEPLPELLRPSSRDGKEDR